MGIMQEQWFEVNTKRIKISLISHPTKKDRWGVAEDIYVDSVSWRHKCQESNQILSRDVGKHAGYLTNTRASPLSSMIFDDRDEPLNATGIKP